MMETDRTSAYCSRCWRAAYPKDKLGLFDVAIPAVHEYELAMPRRAITIAMVLLLASCTLRAQTTVRFPVMLSIGDDRPSYQFPRIVGSAAVEIEGSGAYFSAIASYSPTHKTAPPDGDTWSIASEILAKPAANLFVGGGISYTRVRTSLWAKHATRAEGAFGIGDRRTKILGRYEWPIDDPNESRGAALELRHDLSRRVRVGVAYQFYWFRSSDGHAKSDRSASVRLFGALVL